MDKNIFKEFITNEIANKQTLLLSNSINDEDKAAIQTQIDGLNAIVEKIDALEEDETTNELIDELKQTVTELGEKLTALNEKINLKNNETEKEETEMNTNYLETKNALHDFAQAIRNSKSAEEFKSNWNEYLVKNDIDTDSSISIASGSEQGYLPTAIKGMINDLWEKGAGWLSDLNYTGAKAFYVRHNASDKDAETSRAKGWKKNGVKSQQEIELSAKLLSGQFIYKIVSLDNQTIFDNDENLVTYVLSELSNQLLAEIRRCILVGDGRQANDVNKIDSFEAIAKTTTDAYTTVTTASNTFLVDDLKIMVDTINNPDEKPIYLWMSTEDLRTVSRVQASDTATPVYMSTEDVASQLGVAKIFKTDLLGSDYKAVAMIPDEYYMVGAPNLLNGLVYKAHDIWTNRDVYRNETVAGGGLNAMKSSAVLLPAE
jgi:HK97 family phage major capsid protein